MVAAALGGRAVSGDETSVPGPMAVGGDARTCQQRLPLPRGHPCLHLQVLYSIGVETCSCEVYKYA